MRSCFGPCHLEKLSGGEGNYRKGLYPGQWKGTGGFFGGKEGQCSGRDQRPRENVPSLVLYAGPGRKGDCLEHRKGTLSGRWLGKGSIRQPKGAGILCQSDLGQYLPDHYSGFSAFGYA